MNLESWNRFNINGLAVPRQLMGMGHRFALGSESVRVRLPSADSARQDSHRDVASAKSWYGDAKSEAQSYDVHQVDVWVNSGTDVDLNASVLKRSPNATELISSDQQFFLETEAQHLGVLAGRAFAYWLSVMRWTTDNHQLGHLETESHASGWTTYLVDCESKRRVWVATGHLAIQLSPDITVTQWESAAEMLAAGKTPPLYVLLKHDALSLFENGDYRRCIVELAICCETFLRSRVLGSLPELPRDVWKYVEEGNINQYLSKFFPEALTQEGKDAYKPLKQELQSLMSKRNDIMHRGESEGASRDNCLRFSAVVNQLLAL